jgi:transcriptional regulator with XRE-family HTH domain
MRQDRTQDPTQDVGPSPLALLRERLGLSRTRLAQLVGCTYTYVYNVETGMTATMPRSVVIALEKAGVDVGDLAEEHRRWRRSRAEGLQRQIAVEVAGQGARG